MLIKFKELTYIKNSTSTLSMLNFIRKNGNRKNISHIADESLFRTLKFFSRLDFFLNFSLQIHWVYLIEAYYEE
jgi:hypothetical protein